MGLIISSVSVLLIAIVSLIIAIVGDHKKGKNQQA